MPETPKKVGAVVDNAINKLNAHWDLQLPRLHGGAAEAAESTSALAKRCAARLRYLSFRLETLDAILEDFDVRARQLYAKWVFKPQQENGTLPRFPVTKSNLDRDVKKGRVLGLNRLTHDRRQKLLELLDNAINDDYELARASDAYQRKSTQPSCTNSVTSRRHSPRKLRHDQVPASTSAQGHNLPSVQELPPPPPPKMTRKRSADGTSSGKVLALPPPLIQRLT
jgi:hypothetical protein